MDEDFIKNYSLLDGFNVSRETCLDFERLISMISSKNQKINIIGKKTSKNNEIRTRHIIDSAQAIDFVDLNHSTTYDLGTGGGMPGIVIAIMAKNLKKKIKMNLFEKSYHKSSFLKEVSKELNLKTEIIQKDVFKTKELNSGTIMARAFKPMPVVLDLVYKNFSKYKNLILFMGKSGKKTLSETLKDWDFEYKEKRSLTNKDSFLLSIKNIKKKY
jgi:16S rRNA (guanine527-N7)-methyltransferase